MRQPLQPLFNGLSNVGEAVNVKYGKGELAILLSQACTLPRRRGKVVDSIDFYTSPLLRYNAINHLRGRTRTRRGIMRLDLRTARERRCSPHRILILRRRDQILRGSNDNAYRLT